MAKSVNMCVRIDPELKAQAEEVLDQLGMNMNGTINMFLTQIVREKRVPLNLSLNADDNARSDLRISKKERENGIDGVDARELLKEMKKIVADAKTKESSYDDKAVI
jgi:DNA-damage-inducible protein J